MGLRVRKLEEELGVKLLGVETRPWARTAVLGEIDPLSELELEALAAPSPPEFEDHYAAKIWRYYVSRGVDAGVIPAAWRQAIQ